jgi:Protein of unknown function (DUF3460)
MDKYYVSEFTAFMDRYLKQHPEVVEDQRRIWSDYWGPKKVDPEELKASEMPTNYLH